jgi:ribosomal protein S18 acetylase RimI-like enzyme
MKIVIRKAVKKDAPGILRLIKELADYEKAPGEVQVTLKELERDGFGKNPAFRVFVAETEGKLAGIALYYFKYSTWKGRSIYLDDIIVSQKYRRNGIGGKLFEEVIKVAKAKGLRKIDWQVLNWNKPAIAFYKKYNSVISNEWLNVTLYEKQLAKLKF